MVNQNGGVIIVFSVRGNGSRLKRALFPPRSDSLITVLLPAACRHTGAGGGGYMCAHTHTHRYLHEQTRVDMCQGKLEYTHTSREKLVAPLLLRRGMSLSLSLSTSLSYPLFLSFKHLPLQVPISLTHYLILTWYYHILMIVQPFPSFWINFPHQTAFTCHYPIQPLPFCPPGKIRETSGREQRVC